MSNVRETVRKSPGNLVSHPSIVAACEACPTALCAPTAPCVWSHVIIVTMAWDRSIPRVAAHFGILDLNDVAMTSRNPSQGRARFHQKVNFPGITHFLRFCRFSGSPLACDLILINSSAGTLDRTFGSGACHRVGRAAERSDCVMALVRSGFDTLNHGIIAATIVVLVLARVEAWRATLGFAVGLRTFPTHRAQSQTIAASSAYFDRMSARHFHGCAIAPRL